MSFEFTKVVRYQVNTAKINHYIYRQEQKTRNQSSEHSIVTNSPKRENMYV